MAVVMRFTPKGLTHDKYNQVIKRLEEAGVGAPRGRMQHYFFGDKDNLLVSEIWDSRASFDKFAETMMPIVKEAGIDPGEPVELEIFNMIEGAKSDTAKP